MDVSLLGNDSSRSGADDSMKILLLPDRLDNWSAHNRTKRLQQYITQHEVDIKAGEYVNLTDYETFMSYDVVHFNYSSHFGKHRSLIERTLNHENRPVLIGSVIGHRWHAAADDHEQNVQTRETIETMRLMDHVTAQTPELHERLIANGITHSTMIPNGVDRNIFPYKRILVVGHVGPLFEKPVGDYKGGNITREACEQLNLMFSVPGCYGGPSRGPKTPGQRGQDKMVDWYKTIDVLCQPSSGEGCSNPIMECLAMNIRIICTQEAITPDLWPYVILCKRTIDDVMEKLDTSFLVPHWYEVAQRFRRMYERLARRQTQGVL